MNVEKVKRMKCKDRSERMEKDKQYWQVAAGSAERDYSELFIKYGIMLIGTGKVFGDFTKNERLYKKHRGKEVSKSDFRAITDFTKNVRKGDIVVLRKARGKSMYLWAVGKVVGDYEFLDVFGDVGGWGLQHTRRVEWHQPKHSIYLSKTANTPTFTRLNRLETINRANYVIAGGNYKTQKPGKLPKPQKIMPDETLRMELRKKGLKKEYAMKLTNEINKNRKLINWYHYECKNIEGKPLPISEHETRTFLVIPLLESLGWKEPNIKIELNQVDVALFEKEYQGKKNDCKVLIETKRLNAGLSAASSQVKDYAKKYPQCKKLIVTNGECYILMNRKGKEKAYFNILKPRLHHPFEKNVGGAVNLLGSLIPK
ncbi:MAG: hypothetical protein KJ955_05380 [Nanoarchaeota archaeon]|nr:hypothetical protein [Nanoarchaeota archaeon]